MPSMEGKPEAMGTVMKDRIEDRARFDRIRYANCWEDADILLEAMAIKPGGFYLSVSSAGDNRLSLLSGNPAQALEPGGRDA